MEATATSPRAVKTWLIVGASRGIGHEFVRQLLLRGDHVLATMRNVTPTQNPSFWTKGEREVDPHSLRTLECDMLDEQSIDVTSFQTLISRTFRV